jgi:hypothetical protein
MAGCDRWDLGGEQRRELSLIAAGAVVLILGHCRNDLLIRIRHNARACHGIEPDWPLGQMKAWAILVSGGIRRLRLCFDYFLSKIRREMGDFERTFGAGADAGNIIDSLAAGRSVRTTSFLSPRSAPTNGDNLKHVPEGMNSIEVRLFADLAEESARINYEATGTRECTFSEWQLLKIIARLPTRQELDSISVIRRSGCAPSFDVIIRRARDELADRGRRLKEIESEDR